MSIIIQRWGKESKEKKSEPLSSSTYLCLLAWSRVYMFLTRVIVFSEKEATIAVVKPTHLEVDLATNEGIATVFLYDVCKFFSHWAFVSVTSSPSRGMMGWVERTMDETVHLFEYKEKGNIPTASDDNMVSFILLPADIFWYLDLSYSSMNFTSIGWNWRPSLFYTLKH